MRYLCYVILLLTVMTCGAPDQAADAETSVPEPVRKTPTESPPSKKATVSGEKQKNTVATPEIAATPKGDDLNGDGQRDYLEIVTTGEENDGLGFKRQLTVYSGEGADLDAWYTADEALLSTEHGGMMGDPLEDVSIVDGAIVIKHFGGSRSKWHYTHRFRWQNGDFQLIGATVETDDSCTANTVFDYNLSTGDAMYIRTPQDCTNEKILKGEAVKQQTNRRMALPSMDGFEPGTNDFAFPGVEDYVYF